MALNVHKIGWIRANYSDFTLWKCVLMTWCHTHNNFQFLSIFFFICSWTACTFQRHERSLRNFFQRFHWLSRADYVVIFIFFFDFIGFFTLFNAFERLNWFWKNEGLEVVFCDTLALLLASSNVIMVWCVIVPTEQQSSIYTYNDLRCAMLCRHLMRYTPWL